MRRPRLSARHGLRLRKSGRAPDRTCDFRTGKIILQRNIEPEQIKKLLKDGKTDLLHKFISKKGRPFSAFLVRGADGKVTFEFAPREAKVGAKAAAKTAEKSACEEASQPRREKRHSNLILLKFLATIVYGLANSLR